MDFTDLLVILGFVMILGFAVSLALIVRRLIRRKRRQTL